MAAEYPYHKDEHYEPPHDMLGVLQDEMSTYRSGQGFRECLVSLNQIYGNSPFGHCMRKYARFFSFAHAQDREQYTDRKNELAFFSGSMLAAHSKLRPESLEFRRAILGNDFLDPLYNCTKPKKQAKLIEGIVGELEDWKNVGWMASIEKLEPAIQVAVLDAASLSFEDAADSYEREIAFLSGFTLATHLINGEEKRLVGSTQAGF